MFNAKDGSEIKSLDLPTNADFSKIMPTHDGRFIVRTGDISFTLYSANFEKVASRSSAVKEAPVRGRGLADWRIAFRRRSCRGPSAGFSSQRALSATSAIEKAASDVEVLNADTLQLARSFTVPSIWEYWSAANHFLLTSTPQPSASAPPGLFGALNIDGTWSPSSP